MNATLLLTDRTDAEYLEMEAMLMAFIDDVRSEAYWTEDLGAERLHELVQAALLDIPKPGGGQNGACR